MDLSLPMRRFGANCRVKWDDPYGGECDDTFVLTEGGDEMHQVLTIAHYALTRIWMRLDRQILRSRNAITQCDILPDDG